MCTGPLIRTYEDTDVHDTSTSIYQETEIYN